MSDPANSLMMQFKSDEETEKNAYFSIEKENGMEFLIFIIHIDCGLIPNEIQSHDSIIYFIEDY